MPLVLPDMYSRKWGRIVAISLLSTTPSPSYAYNSGKAARTNALLLAREEAWKKGVTIDVISPGPVDGKQIPYFTEGIWIYDNGMLTRKDWDGEQVIRVSFLCFAAVKPRFGPFLRRSASTIAMLLTVSIVQSGWMLNEAACHCARFSGIDEDPTL